MINLNGVLAVLDRHITLNWDDGPTLMRISAQVRYQHASATAGDGDQTRTLSVTASSRCSDEPLCFNATSADGALSATWTWLDDPPGFACSLVLSNSGDDDLRVIAVDVLRIDAKSGGILALGAPASDWRIGIPGDLTAPQPTTALIRADPRPSHVLLQPAQSDRSRPPALCISAASAQFALQTDAGRFTSLVATIAFEGQLLAPGIALSTPDVRIFAGDDGQELLALLA
jgi:hypothetical protein